MNEFRHRASEEPCDHSRDYRNDHTRELQDDYSRVHRIDRSRERYNDLNDDMRDKERDSASTHKTANDIYLSPVKGKSSHPTNKPHKNSNDPRRMRTYKKSYPGSRHARLERKHERREKEREDLRNGNLAPPPGAGPNWAKGREKTLARYAKATRRRHKKHEKRVRKGAEKAAETAAGQAAKNPG